MNELLFKFITDSFCAKKVSIKEFKRAPYEIVATVEGDIFDLTKHTVGTEIKAITYSNMQIIETPVRVDLFVIVDI
jgi:SHS2 domain-containing protein